MTGQRQRARSEQGGFTLIEILIALTVLLVGVSGILAMQLTLTRSGGFSRHLSEATQLAETQMEILMLLPVTIFTDGMTATENDINPQGGTDAPAIYNRTWLADLDTGENIVTLTVTVQWFERGKDSSQVILTNIRSTD
jgi:prepilin-type N-terminal cleavage/methylation domain-containing protein